MPLQILIDELYGKQPDGVLYHYASLGATLKIIESHSLLATDIRYFNDTAELNHAASLLNFEISRRIREENNKEVLIQFQNWLNHRITDGHMQFVTCFTKNGNLLSQWRGYCPPSLGVSIGFHANMIVESAQNQNFIIGQCIYSLDDQKKIIIQLIDCVENLAKQEGGNSDLSQRHPSNSFADVFEKIEDNLLKIAALIKHPSFHEEQEWRVVSSIITNYVTSPIEYREGKSLLIPFIRFNLPETSSRKIEIDNVVLGPTAHINKSMNSLSNYLSKNQASPRNGIRYCQIPYMAL